MTFADRFLPAYMKVADEAYESVLSWKGGDFFGPDMAGGVISVHEVAFKAGTTGVPNYRLMNIVVSFPTGNSVQYEIEGLGGHSAELSLRGALIARSAVNLWAGMASREAAMRVVDFVGSAVRAGSLDREGLEELWREALVREVMSA